MRRRLALVACVLATLSSAAPLARAEGGTAVRRTMPADEVSPARDYVLYTPPGRARVKARALVVFLHGCSQTADDAMDGVPWNDLADAHGFAVVYPEQSTEVDGSSGRCWNWGQAHTFPRGQAELESVARITRTVRDQLRVPRGRVFVAGISAGAMMSAAMAATYPDLYAAMGSVIGCSFPCGDPSGVQTAARMGPHARVVPGFFVAGSADYLVNPAMAVPGARGWAATNDRVDDGAANDSIASSSPSSTEERGFEQPVVPGSELCLQPSNNPCPAGVLGWEEYPATIERFERASDGVVIVESWLLHGMSHSYPGGHPTEGTFTDPHGPDVTSAMWAFFVAHAR